jgi:anti-sigma factor (TIGR02949 family)
VNPVHISCADFVAEIGNLLDGDVDPQLRAHLEAHLATCKACTVVFDSTRKTIRIVSESATFELSPEELKSCAASVMSKIRALKP